jgi:plasmid stabilization system protein ParE
MLPVVFHRAAASEIDNAWDWYEDIRDGLGDEFLASVDEMVNRIAIGPRDYPLIYPHARRALVHRFPYAIYYTLDPHRVVVLGVLHVRQDASFVSSRVDHDTYD